MDPISDEVGGEHDDALVQVITHADFHQLTGSDIKRALQTHHILLSNCDQLIDTATLQRKLGKDRPVAVTGERNRR